MLTGLEPSTFHWRSSVDWQRFWGAMSIVAGIISGNRQEVKLADAHAVAETAKANTEAIRTQNLDLALKLEGERIKRLELEASLAPRRLSQPIAEQLTNELKRVAEPKAIKIVSMMTDPESLEFAGQFEQVFRDAGWDVEVSHAVVGGVAHGGSLQFDPEKVESAYLRLP